MDQRGSSKSSLFDCPSSMINGSIFHPTTAQCTSELESKYESDFSAFSITSAATDVATFISTYQANSKTFVYGVGYGSVLTERLLHLNTTEVIGYVLDAVKTTSGADVSEFMYESKSAVDFGEITRQMFEFCVGTKECMAKFPSESLLDLIERMTTNYSGYISSKCVGIMSTPENRQSSFALKFKSILADMYMNEQAVGLLAAFVYRVNRCTDQDFEVVSRFIYSVHPHLASQPFDESEYKASLLYKLITFSEMWETPTPSSETMMMRHTNASMSTGPMTSLVTSYCELTQENSTACAAETAPSYASPPIVYKRDHQPDAQAPQKYADRLYKALNGSNKAFFNPKYMTHGSLWWSPQNQFHQATTTGMDTLVAYVQNNADLSKLTIAYGVGGIPSTVVIANEIESMQLFNVKDAFEGKLDDDASSGSKRTVVIVVVVVAVLLVLAGAAFVLYRRRRQANAKKQTFMITEDEALKEEAREAASPSASTSYHYNAEQARV
uniref:Peptidase S33 tripeptidyl aminopeptidase-like C-terminal domain-containing protein n=1 Tax=Globisporangium ultimum (strain ATCC 200006 / CBS 805.95 / DAOM BR144) TaxID=431595 RepID=K3XAR9_GLOUD